MPVKRSRRFPETTSSVPVARQFVAESLSALEPEVGETAALLVSELATNAVVHATSDFAVTVRLPDPDRAGAGRGGGRRPRASRCRSGRRRPPPTVGAFSWWPRLAEEWGVEGAGPRAGKTIWFELAPATAAAGAAAAVTAAAAARSDDAAEPGAPFGRLCRRRRRGLSFSDAFA